MAGLAVFFRVNRGVEHRLHLHEVYAMAFQIEAPLVFIPCHHGMMVSLDSRLALEENQAR
jgi:hypothetical protein